MFLPIINRKRKKNHLNIETMLYNAGNVLIVVSLHLRADDDHVSFSEMVESIHAALPDKGGPVYVRFPAPACDAGQRPDPSAPYRPLSETFARRRLVPASMGWSGAPRFLLTRQEIAWDDTWMRRNDDGTGIEQLAQAVPTVAFPAGADESDAAALTGEFAYVIVGPDAGTGAYRLFAKAAGVRCDGVEFVPGSRRNVAVQPQGGPRLVHIRLFPGDDLASNITACMPLFESTAATDIATFYRLCPHKPGGPAFPSSPEPICRGPSLAAGAAAASEARSGSVTSGERNRWVLRQTACRGSCGGEPPRSTKPPGRTPAISDASFAPLGSMAGEATIQQGELRVATASGRLAGITRAGHTVLGTQRIQGYASISGDLAFLEMKSATGFEAPAIHGVTEIASLKLERFVVNAVASTFAADHYPAAVVRMEAYINERPANPAAPLVDEFSLYRLLVAELPPGAEGASLTSWYPDGTRRTWNVPDTPGWYWVGGSSIRMELGKRVLTIAVLGAIAPVAMQVVRDGHSLRLYAHPFLSGRTVRLSDYAGWRFAATVSIGEEIAPEGAAFSAPQALRDAIYPYSFQPSGTISPE